MYKYVIAVLLILPLNTFACGYGEEEYTSPPIDPDFGWECRVGYDPSVWCGGEIEEE